MSEEAQTGGNGGAGETAGAGGRPVVLVAGDDATTRFLLKEGLEGEGFSVEEAGDGLEAVERFVSGSPDLVILDVAMPVMDGFEVCARIRERPEGELTPILMLAGRDDTESIGRACEAGATDFATKPFNWVALGHRVRFMLRAQRALVDLRQSEARLARAHRIARLGHWEWDAGSGSVSWSREVHTIFGTDPSTSIPTLDALLGLVDAADRDAVRQHRQEAIERGTPYAVDLRVARPDGNTRFVHEQVEALVGAAGEIRGLCGTVQDVTERRETEARLRFLAKHDALTELPNRGFFVEQVSAILARMERHGGMLAVLLVDIDQFKRFNDTLGHAQCDQLLREMAGRLRACLRLSDPLARDAAGDGQVTLARPGGDEFLAALTDIEGAPDAARAAQRVVEALREGFRVGQQEVFLSASIGISLFPQDGADAETLITRAASALSHAPDRGWGSYRFFDEATHSAALGRVALEGQLRLALERDELCLHYQPLVNARTGELVALEALARWPHPERGMVSPAEFIPLAEEIGLIEALDDAVLNATCAQIHSWRASGYEPPPVAINLSAGQFHQPGLVAKLAKAAGDRGLDPGCLEIEVTESVLMKDTDRALATLQELRKMGLRIAVDDFGTGYSSLAYLRRFPFDSLKIDRALVSEAVDRSDAASIALAILTLAHSLELSTVAEGVETEEQAAFFRENGCRALQGFLFARAVPPGELIPFLDGSKTLPFVGEGGQGPPPAAALDPNSSPH